jgi:hypothetical protein
VGDSLIITSVVHRLSNHTVSTCVVCQQSRLVSFCDDVRG